MRILHVATELYPLVRTGGLGDVLAALPQFQRKLGADARLLLPGYPAVEAAFQAERTIWLGPLFGARSVVLKLGRVENDPTLIYVISAPELFDRPGNPYLGPDGLDWPDNVYRFGLLSWMGAAIARGLADPEWHADILQAHDWHAALAPAYVALADDSAHRPATILTIHNLAFQGRFPRPFLAPLGIPESAYTADGLEFFGEMSFLKAGIIYADRVTTVSPGYAKDMATPEYGHDMEGVIQFRGKDVRGILNGVDEERWDPSTDPEIGGHYDSATLDAKDANRQALLGEFGLIAGAGPLVGVISRLSEQKGIDLIIGALPRALQAGCSFAIVGSGDADLEAAITEAARANPGRVSVKIGFSDSLAHKIYAGADSLLVPSRFEPCGLTQLYALRYGSPPVVRRTGGLADTVVDLDGEPETGTGFVFDQATPDALAEAIERMIRAYQDKRRWKDLQRRAMAQKFRWSDAAGSYQRLYEEIVPHA